MYANAPSQDYIVHSEDIKKSIIAGEDKMKIKSDKK